MAGAVRHVVEVAGVVDRDRGGRRGPRSLLEQEELDLGVGVEGEAEVGRPGQRALQHVARVGEARRCRPGSCRSQNIRAVPGLLAAPRQDLERRRVGLGQHVGLVDAREALDGRAVEADALGEGALELGRRDGHGLQRAEHVGEPQPDEADVALFDRAQHELFLTVHVSILPHGCFTGVATARRFGAAEPRSYAVRAGHGEGPPGRAPGGPPWS